jgi:DnaK suppressor protein
MTKELSNDFLKQCTHKLQLMKQDLLNRARSSRAEFVTTERSSGDEIDQSVAQLTEHQFLVTQDRLRKQLLEIEMALARIENGKFGICEETEELIEIDRLLAIPYTRLSIEGAEIREAAAKKFAR